MRLKRCSSYVGPISAATAPSFRTEVTLGSGESFWAVDKSEASDSFYSLEATAMHIGERCVICLDTNETYLSESPLSAAAAKLKPRMAVRLREATVNIDSTG